MRAWHFVRASRRLGYGDDRLVEPGVTLTHDGPLVLCGSGLHASIDPLSALTYAPGPLVCRVECGGEIVHGNDKLVCSERTVLWMADATDTLRHTARLCALDVIRLWDAPDVVRRYLETGDESLRDAAEAAAHAAAWDAAEAAAKAAAWDATWDAAKDAAEAARSAAWDAAHAAEAARSAAWAAAWAAAKDAAKGAAAWASQSLRLTQMLEALS